MHEDAPRPLLLSSAPVAFSRHDSEAVQQGKVRFRGGIELLSYDSDFGGLSGLLVSGDGTRFLAVTDEAHWVTGTLAYEAGNLASASGHQIAPLLDLGGAPLHEKNGDAEGLASSRLSGTFDENSEQADLFVSFEVEHRVWRYPFGKNGVRAVPVEVPIPREAVLAPRNGGLEGITAIGEGLLFAVSERHLDEDGNYRAWTIPFASPAGLPAVAIADAASAGKPASRPCSIRPHPPFAMTDVRMLPGGDLLTLERRYNPATGVGIEMRRIPAASLATAGKDCAALDGEVVASFDPSYEIDNMEGLSIRHGERGETLVYAVSDDNFNRPMQRTLLIMYELLP